VSLVASLVLFTLAVLPVPAPAWNIPGHMLSGIIAYQVLQQDSPQTIEKVKALLENHPWYANQWQARLQDVSGADRDMVMFMQAARWADDIRTKDKAQNRPSWHYINLPFRPEGQPRFKPWLATSGLHPALLGACEEAGPQLSSDMRQTIRETLGAGEWMTIQKPWESRRDAMLDILGKALPYTFRPILQIDPVNARPLIEALSGRWSFKKIGVTREMLHGTSPTLLLSCLPGWSSGKRCQRTPKCRDYRLLRCRPRFEPSLHQHLGDVP
jgi:hypothetical protein